MVNLSQTRYETVDASPVKSFFVSMLTRDIKLEDAILDLLDNCVDGILRSGGSGETDSYEGFSAEITFSSDTFSIHDNCGGIPWALHEYAFRMGRAPERPTDDAPGSVGVYGIGMKRAIFKIGRQCLISTRNGDDQYEVAIDPDWIADESQWRIPVQSADYKGEEDGTTIVIGDLYSGISEMFGERSASFESELRRMVSTHYAYIIDKGFEVSINGEPVKPRTTKIIHDNRSAAGSNAIRPFVFRTSSDGVEVYLAVGFTRPIPSQSELLDEQQAPRYSSADAGWTVLCNDRAVLYCDKSELTGWGEAGVPRYHTQFIAISGVVEFRSDDPWKLPMTTTKRGIDGSSPLYLQVKNKMREGMKVFTDYTNRWKGRADESAKHVRRGKALSLDELKVRTEELSFNRTRSRPLGEQHKPRLPMPPRIEPTMRRISFVKEVSKINEVAEYIGDSALEPSEVGESCFDTIYEEAQN